MLQVANVLKVRIPVSVNIRNRYSLRRVIPSDVVFLTMQSTHHRPPEPDRSHMWKDRLRNRSALRTDPLRQPFSVKACDRCTASEKSLVDHAKYHRVQCSSRECPEPVLWRNI